MFLKFLISFGQVRIFFGDSFKLVVLNFQFCYPLPVPELISLQKLYLYGQLVFSVGGLGNPCGGGIFLMVLFDILEIFFDVGRLVGQGGVVFEFDGGDRDGVVGEGLPCVYYFWLGFIHIIFIRIEIVLLLK